MKLKTKKNFKILKEEGLAVLFKKLYSKIYWFYRNNILYQKEKRSFNKILHKGSNISYYKGFNVFNGHHNIFLGSEINLVDSLINAGDDIGKVIIEDYVFFGHGVKIIARGHNYNFFNKERQQKVTEKPIHIKEGAWIGSGAIILGGVTIGKHSVIGAGSIVTKDVPDYAIAVGNPIKILKYIKN